jgi:hypothetical protein
MGRRHNERLRKELREIERDPFRTVDGADHTDAYTDPDPVNGRVPDITTENTLFGTETLIEVEQAGDDSRHTREQADAFGAAAEADPLLEFETVTFGDDSDDGGLLNLF